MTAVALAVRMRWLRLARGVQAMELCRKRNEGRKALWTR